MPKIVFVLVFVAFIALAACVGVRAPLLRGVALETGAGDSGMLASNARPAMAVKPADGFRPVGHGVADAAVSLDGSAMSRGGVRVWYALHDRSEGRSQLVSELAEVNDNNWVWAINPLFTDRRGASVLREMDLSRYGVPWTAITYVRSAAKDPWMPAFVAAGSGWQGDVLVRQYTWWTGANHVKVVVEYREPMPNAYIEDDRAALRAFEERADDSFHVLRKELGDTLPASIEKSRGNSAGVSANLLGAVLGEVNPGMNSRVDSL